MRHFEPTDRRRTRLPAMLVPTILFLAASTWPAAAQEPVTDEALREQLQTRDAVIIELQRRLEQLERRLEREGVIEVEPADPLETVVTPRPQQGLDVDELAAERALERTLVETGALLLAAGQAEVSPSVSFLHRDQKAPFAFGGQVFETRVKRDEFTFGLQMAAGLPFDSQLEINVPYELVRQDVSLRGGGTAIDSDDNWGNAIGDVAVGLAKTVWREDGGWAPDIIVRGIYDSNTGERFDNDVAIGGGFHTLRGQVVALKRQDPLAFTAGFTYSYTFEDDDFQPGQQFSLSLGANLALSPETSLSVSLTQSYTDKFEVDGDRIGGSDQTAATFDFGGSAIIAPRTLLRLTTSIGLTDDSPDYGVRASVGYRFSLPFF